MLLGDSHMREILFNDFREFVQQLLPRLVCSAEVLVQQLSSENHI